MEGRVQADNKKRGKELKEVLLQEKKESILNVNKCSIVSCGHSNVSGASFPDLHFSEAYYQVECHHAI